MTVRTYLNIQTKTDGNTAYTYIVKPESLTQTKHLKNDQVYAHFRRRAGSVWSESIVADGIDLCGYASRVPLKYVLDTHMKAINNGDNAFQLVLTIPDYKG